MVRYEDQPKMRRGMNKYRVEMWEKRSISPNHRDKDRFSLMSNRTRCTVVNIELKNGYFTIPTLLSGLMNE